ncbi:Sec-independent protein translocase subunit TatB [Gordonia sp. X0973]|uniref:Sec-independent protein translocase protein TatB n=1 Tax=Gordonia sp. X0973 TaxID=2742602 RepID=UPI000F51FC39|nr:Sec-independent protein translocase protein TatB [Gordonia sp. X0973]QKT06810.1 Sec-independent protein translocase subunit TatB [Gordonia sp. X0973]
MFANLGWGEVLVLIAAGLIILGPERLPGAISSGFAWLRKAREYVSGATADLRDEMGTDFDEFREPLRQLGELRSTNPRTLVTKHLLGGDDSLLDPRTYTDQDFGPSEGAAGRRSRKSAAEDGAAGSAARHDITDWDAT